VEPIFDNGRNTEVCNSTDKRLQPTVLKMTEQFWREQTIAKAEFWLTWYVGRCKVRFDGNPHTGL